MNSLNNELLLEFIKYLDSLLLELVAIWLAELLEVVVLVISQEFNLSSGDDANINIGARS
jgi:hypothetical protein